MRYLCLAILLLLAPLAATAQTRPDTILVLDASGSMWGQIDGVNKIVIAREVVADLLADFPADENLGLTVYGHRTRGDCTDIETLIAPAPGTAPAIVAAVNTMNPRGMTPMTDAVIAAANALRSSEQAATVILVSDGIETCNPDPCAAARVLEETGVDFTAHVVGFDVDGEPEALAQMQCLAESTGGLFLTAENADELAAAMETVIAEATASPAPPPAEVDVEITVGLQAHLGAEDGPYVQDLIRWTITAADGSLTETDLNPAAAPLPDGDYAVRAVNDRTGQVVEGSFTVANQPVTVRLVFLDEQPKATLDAPAAAPAGSTLAVGWTGPGDVNDTIRVGRAGADDILAYAYLRDGSPVSLILPGEPGDYELRYAWRDVEIIAVRPLTITPADLALIAPDSAAGGSTVEIGWAGPNQPNDNIQVAEPGGGYSDYRYVTDGNPVALVMPWAPGSYELRYVLQDRETILTRPITITPGEVSITAPDSVPAGARFDLTWTGPAAPNDNVQIGTPGTAEYSDYAYVTDGATLTLTAPSVPGDYELRYQFRDREAILRVPLTVAAVALSLEAPESAGIASDVAVTWQGPGNDGDFIGVGRAGEAVYITYEYVNRGNPVTVPMPVEPGAYELRYYTGGDEVVLTTRPITLTPVDAKLTLPVRAIAGQTVEVGWTGPGNRNAFIGIGRPGEAYETYEYINRGNPVTVLVPAAPGDYEVRFYLGRDDVFVGAVPLTVTAK